ncbi:MAG: UDP-N-acetylmuramate dehydrogenase, partial [Ignavibacteriae bacterium]
GLENLALIPGTVGAAPMQNIGAYGVEQERCFVELQAMERSTREIHTFDRTTCEFGYRESVFKNTLRDRYVIVSVTYRLAKAPHQVNVTYRDVDEEMARGREGEKVEGSKGETVEIRDVYEAVVRIRTRKLPDPAVIGNAGSFFKNPVVSAETYAAMAADHVEMPHYPQADGSVKLAAAWLIDQCGWKGHREDGIGVHDRQALVLVNHGGATGADLIDLARRIQRSVKDRFGVDLTPEVNVW